LGAIRTGLKTTIEAAITGLKVYPTIESVNVVPAVVVVPVDADFVVAMGRGVDTYKFTLLVMVNPSDEAIAQTSLDNYLSGAGTKSIRQAIFNARTLGLTGVDAHVTGWSGYGAKYESAGIQHIGAQLALTVHNPGTA